MSNDATEADASLATLASGSVASMTDNDTERYNGYANRETWAFNLHWQNDQGLYRETLDAAREALRQTKYDAEDWTDSQLGEHVATYWRAIIDSYEDAKIATPAAFRMFEREVGSWWRIDYREVGEAVRESLGAEGMGQVDES